MNNHKTIIFSTRFRVPLFNDLKMFADAAISATMTSPDYDNIINSSGCTRQNSHLRKCQLPFDAQG